MIRPAVRISSASDVITDLMPSFFSMLRMDAGLPQP